uniref:Uncharacterized protein n=1 Tax=Magallana gigas TaxID=29159 RepID=K1Q2C6_MAGGI
MDEEGKKSEVKEDFYKASSVMCRDFLENLVKCYTLRLGSCCDHHPTFESDVKILIFKRLLMNLLAEKIHSQALPEAIKAFSLKLRDVFSQDLKYRRLPRNAKKIPRVFLYSTL